MKLSYLAQKKKYNWTAHQMMIAVRRTNYMTQQNNYAEYLNVVKHHCATSFPPRIAFSCLALFCLHFHSHGCLASKQKSTHFIVTARLQRRGRAQKSPTHTFQLSLCNKRMSMRRLKLEFSVLMTMMMTLYNFPFGVSIWWSECCVSYSCILWENIIYALENVLAVS